MPSVWLVHLVKSWCKKLSTKGVICSETQQWTLLVLLPNPLTKLYILKHCFQACILLTSFWHIYGPEYWCTDVTGAFLLPGRSSVQLLASTSSAPSTTLSRVSHYKQGLRPSLYRKMYMVYMEGVQGIDGKEDQLGLWHLSHKRNLTTLTTALIASKTMGSDRTSWKPRLDSDQAPSTGLPCRTVSFKVQYKNSICCSFTSTPPSSVVADTDLYSLWMY